MNQYIISTEAIRDMEQILDYLANTNINAGEKFLEEFSKKCRYLTQFPLMGRSYREIRPYLRGLPMKNYIIFYRLTNWTVRSSRKINEFTRVSAPNAPQPSSGLTITERLSTQGF